ncbi:MAG: sulfatase-like hydrolase/transferase [Kiritimatiellales bacterium]|nr:sulfatase-like hydrolase/transferase [Kiritimatiellales bacterium]
MKRRAFLRSAALGATAMGTAGFAAGKTDKPNILFIFADDQCHEAIRAFGKVDIDTPNLDKLVKRGTTFTHAYNMGSFSGAVCVASRSMLNTGTSVWNSKRIFDSIEEYQKDIAAGRIWPQYMKSAGYRTYFTGKWHVGSWNKGFAEEACPQVFDVANDIRKGMPNQTKEGYNRPKSKADYEAGWKPWEKERGGFWEGGKHWSEMVGDRGEEYLAQAAKEDTPFFMYLAFNAPHDPRQSPKEYVDKYPLDRIPVPANKLPEYPYAEAICGKNLRDEQLAPYPRTDYAVKVNRQEYYAIISHMDAQIGRILAALEKSGKADNTYIFFSADHGLAVGHHGLIGKQNMYDHSVRVPFIINGPGVKAGKRIDAPIYLQDVMPTTLELAGVPKPEQVFFNSVMPLVRGESKGSYNAIYGCYLDRQRMITKDGWKLIHYPTIQVDLLYNLTVDPQEMNDLAKNPEYAGKVKELHSALRALCKEMNDPLDLDHPPAPREKTGKKNKQKKK